MTSKPSPLAPVVLGSSSCALYLASLALSKPRWIPMSAARLSFRRRDSGNNREPETCHPTASSVSHPANKWPRNS
ncbi:hypothetical protein EYF80_046044 [Liparis tanakae]|uniref:Uncharacterized protein n=1 Tax=Liparis tanakae TaxID=230148 RepID=A0A4Z2FSN2_9TELE|nr:hypothetical protein EYF80_046044 [Liparis tanakae]